MNENVITTERNTPIEYDGKWICVGENSFGARYMCPFCNREVIGYVENCPKCRSTLNL